MVIDGPQEPRRAKYADIETLDPKGVTMCLDGFGDLRMALRGTPDPIRVSAVRAFPLSALDTFIALKDESGKEIGIIADVSQLDHGSARVLMDELGKCYHMPKIVRINDIDETYGVPKWDVETNKGRRRFELKSRRDSRLLADGRVVITDMDGNRYEIPDYTALDKRSIGLIEQEV